MQRISNRFFFPATIWVLVTLSAAAQRPVRYAVDLSVPDTSSPHFHRAADPLIQYYGRIDLRNPSLPRFWSSGVYIKVKCKGDRCTFYLNDEVLYGKVHNYIEIVTDGRAPYRLQTAGAANGITISHMGPGIHTLIICKDTESSNGYLEFAGIRCEKLLSLSGKPALKMEFIGNSITCGSSMDLSAIPCGKGEWYDQHNAYMSYGPLTARALGAQWQLTSVSGIGLIHSCCDLEITMPQVWDKTDMRNDSVSWDFNRYIPDILTICLGQNDGIQDSAVFCNAYSDFVRTIRTRYPHAKIILLTSPMADPALAAVLVNYLSAITKSLRHNGDKEVSRYFFKKRYHTGCGEHPDLKEHQQISDELVKFIRRIT